MLQGSEPKGRVRSERQSQPKADPPLAEMGLCLVGHRSIHSKSGYSIRPGLNVTFLFLCPRSPGLVPWSRTSTNNELLSK
jgi:hypothetical protein